MDQIEKDEEGYNYTIQFLILLFIYNAYFS